jgi:peptide/nickel transport system ATP-binding protein
MIADEPTTALDVTIQAQILELMNKLKAETGASILFITHDLGVIAEMAQKVVVMYAGKVMEAADVNDLFGDPKHPYTIGLLSSIPVLGTGKKQKRLSTIAGVVPSLFRLPEGCLFNERCTVARKECSRVEPPMTHLGNGHIVCCHQCN